MEAAGLKNLHWTWKYNMLQTIFGPGRENSTFSLLSPPLFSFAIAKVPPAKQLTRSRKGGPERYSSKRKGAVGDVLLQSRKRLVSEMGLKPSTAAASLAIEAHLCWPEQSRTRVPMEQCLPTSGHVGKLSENLFGNETLLPADIHPESASNVHLIYPSLGLKRAELAWTVQRRLAQASIE